MSARDMSKVRRGKRGTDLGGQFIGPKSIARFLLGGSDESGSPTTKAAKSALAKAAPSKAVAKVASARARHPTGPGPDLRTWTTEQLTNEFARLSHTLSGHELETELTKVDAELARREGTPHLEVHDDEHSRRIDSLIAGGRSYIEAYAEVHGLNVAQLEREQRLLLVDQERRPGERRAQTLRRMHFEQVAVAVLQAEDDTRGNLLNKAGRAAGIDPASLWSGQAARARKYASDELKQWWSEHGGRMTVAAFIAHHTGDNPAAIEQARLAGQGRDYGV